MVNIYRVGEDSVKIVSERFSLDPNEHMNGKKMLKIQVDSTISKQITPKDVLESVKKCKNLDGDKVVKIRGKEYVVSVLRNKSDVYVLGGTANNSFGITDNYFGTIHISPLPTTQV